MTRFALTEGERILTAYAERANGPGWSNTPIWIVVVGLDGKLRQECIQPDQQTADMVTLYRISEAAHEAMTSAVMLGTRTKRHKVV